MKYLIPIIILALVAAGCDQPIIGENLTVADDISEQNLITGGEPVPFGELDGERETSHESGESAEYFTIIKNEGDLIILSPEAVDPDGDTVTYSFSEPFDRLGHWQTEFGDAGDHLVTVTATDTKGASSSTSVIVRILPVDQPPMLDCPAEVVVKEGGVVRINCKVTDRETPNVVLSYSGWMVSNSYTTHYEDAGVHTVTVIASDGVCTPVEKQVKVIIQDVNRPPLFPLDFATKILATEGDIVLIDQSGVNDPDGDDINFTFSEPFSANGVWKTTIGDAGVYPVDVVASDGKTTIKQRVTVVIQMSNTAPVLKRIPDIVVSEGETIRLVFDATDREDDKLTFTVSGWMTTEQYTTTYDDAGSYTVKVSVSDGVLSDSQVVHITVQDSNRPPVFTVPG